MASHCARASFGVATDASPNTWGWRLTIFVMRRCRRSRMANSPTSSARRVWKTTWKSRSPSSSSSSARFPISIASRTSYASSMRYGFREARVCARSQGQPSGPRSRAMTSRSRSKRTPGDSVISVPGAKSIIQHAFLRMLGSLLMASSDPEETFKVTDRRRRVQDDEPARPAPPGAPTPSAQRERPRPAREPERDLTGLFVMLASSAAIAMGDAADPVTGERHYDLAHAAEAIDLLALLREKTEGHRSVEETQVLEGLIYDLQL